MLLHAANHFRHQIYAVADGLSLENSVIYTGAVICLVRNSAQDQEWDTVKIAHLSNGRSPISVHIPENVSLIHCFLSLSEIN